MGERVLPCQSQNYLQPHVVQCVLLMRNLRPREGTGLVGGPGAGQSLGWFTTQVRTPTDWVPDPVSPE